jgi:hypothetical protein
MSGRESGQAQQDAARELSARQPTDRQSRRVEAMLRRYLDAALYASHLRRSERREAGRGH